MDSAAFEEMSCALYDKEEGISNADLYRTQYKPQYGIDIIARRRDDQSIEVASCKSQGTISPGEIPQWSKDFLDHWENHWRNQNVKKFVLIIAAPVNSQERAAEVETERARFLDLGLHYDVWAPRQLQEKLRSQKGIVAQFLDPMWLPRLCGEPVPTMETRPSDSGALAAEVDSQIAALQASLSTQVGKRLDQAIEKFHHGELASVEAELLELKIGTDWSHFLPDVKARIVRLEASLLLEQDDISGATRLLDEADRHSLQDEPRLRALIGARQTGPSEGIRILAEPDSKAGLHLKAAFLLDMQRPADALSLLAGHPTLADADPETYRLRAIAHLMLTDRSSAYGAIVEAEKLAPNRVGIRHVGGVVRYAMALSPLAPVEAQYRPNPIDLDLVKNDDKSRLMLEEALARFESLVMNDGRPDLREDQTWAIACMANLRGSQSLAQTRCQEVLARDPTHAGAIIWALARDYEFDSQRSVDALKQSLDRDGGDGQSVVVLAWLLGSRGDEDASRTVLDRYANRFKTSHSIELRDKWRNNLDVRMAAQTSEGPISGGSDGTRLGLLFDRGTTTGDWTPLATFFNELAIATPPPPMLLAVGQILAQANEWGVLAEHIDTVLRFETATAVALAAITAFNNHQPQRAIEILDSRKSFFPDGVLPFELRAMEIRSLDLIGDQSGALLRAAALATESRSIADKMLKADLDIRTGNIRAALPTIQEALTANSLTASESLKLAQVVLLEDVELAKKLWRHALSATVDVELTPLALALAHRLGITSEAGGLYQSLPDLAVGRPELVSMMSNDEIVEFMQQTAQTTEMLGRLYLEGALPNHLLTERGYGDLALLYLSTDPSDRANQDVHPLMIRHGGRPVDLEITLPSHAWRLRMDVTALLIANCLGLLDVLEHLPNPLAISPSLASALLILEHKCHHHQPDRVEYQAAILQAVEGRRLSSLDVPVFNRTEPQQASAILAQMSELLPDDAIFVADDGMPDLSVAAKVRFATIRGVVDGLLAAGELDLSQHQQALERLGRFASQIVSKVVPRGSPLFFLEGSLSHLVEAGLLDQVLRTYHVYVDTFFLELARLDVQKAKAGDRMAAVIGALRRRVSKGIGTGRYTIIPVGWDNDEATDTSGLDAPTIRSMTDLLKAPEAPDALLWVDDRNISGYQLAGQTTIIGICEVLNSLRRDGLISEEARLGFLLHLRTIRAMFIPLEVGEVLHHLALAPISDGQVVETPALGVLRRYFAHALLMDDKLKIDDGVPELVGRPHEIAFLMSLSGLASACVLRQWRTEGVSFEVRYARASWIWIALGIEKYPTRHGGLSIEEAGRVIQKTTIVRLLMPTITIDRSDPLHHIALCRAYLAWLEKQVLLPRMRIETSLARDVMTVVKDFIQDFMDGPDLKALHINVPKILKRLLSARVSLFPDILANHVKSDLPFCARFGIPVRGTITVAGKRFDDQKFWKAVRDAVQYGQAQIRPLRGGRKVRIRRISAAGDEIQLTGGLNTVIKDPGILVLRSDRYRYRQYFENNTDWFDVPPTLRTATIDEILAMPDSASRMERLNGVRLASVISRYGALNGRIRKNERLNFEDFYPPPAQALLDHLRLVRDDERQLHERLDSAATSLLEDYGARRAFSRLAGLPIPTPSTLVQALGAGINRNHTLSWIASVALTPVQMITALRLLIVAGNDGELSASFEKLVARILAKWPPVANLFVALLEWTEAAFKADPDWVTLEPADRLCLVWVHADRITELLTSAGLDPNESARAFIDHKPEQRSDQMLRFEAAYDGAMANPATIMAENLLFHGIGFITDDRALTETFPPDTLEGLRKLLSVLSENGPTPSPWLLFNRSSGDNRAGTFLGSRADGIFDPPADVSNDAIQSMLDTVLSALEVNPLAQEHWVTIRTLGRPALAPAQRERLAKIIDEVDLWASIGEGEYQFTLFRVVVDCSTMLAGGSNRDHLTRELVRVTTLWGKEYPTPLSSLDHGQQLAAGECLSQLTEACATLSKSPDAAESYRHFGEVLYQCVRAWPGIAAEIRALQHNVLRLLPLKDIDGLWRATVALRILP